METGASKTGRWEAKKMSPNTPMAKKQNSHDHTIYNIAYCVRCQSQSFQPITRRPIDNNRGRLAQLVRAWY